MIRFPREGHPPARDTSRTGGLGRFLPQLRWAALELAVIAVLYLLYKAGRSKIRGQEETAVAHAGEIRRLESWLRLPDEASIQGLVGSDALMWMANVYYVSMHFPVMIAFLLIGYLFRARADYRWARNLIVVQTGLALIVHMLYPLAPPRMFPQWGFTDTMATIGPSAYDGASGTVANQFAAMPSLHVGWAVLIAYVVVKTGPRWLAYAAVVHALITCVVVVVTANHWWLDGAAAIALLGVALLLFPAPTRREPASSTSPQAQSAGVSRG